MSWLINISDDLQKSLFIIAITSVVAVIGYFAKYFIEKHFQKQNKKLEYIDKQINEFYGPLYILLKTGKSIFGNLISKNNSALSFIVNNSVDWQLWIKNVFIPMNLKIEKLILEKGYLMIEDTSNDYFDDFMIHSSKYKILAEKWNQNDFSRCHTDKAFPSKLIKYSEDSLNKLRNKQDYFRKKVFMKEKIKDKKLSISSSISRKLLNVSVDKRNRLSIYLRYYKAKNSYRDILYLLYLLVKSTPSKDDIYPIWIDFNLTTRDYQVTHQEQFFDDLKKNKLIGIINYEIDCDLINNKTFVEKTESKANTILFDRNLLDNDRLNIKKSFTLYERVKIIEYYPFVNGYGSWVTPICKVYTEDGYVGWMDGIYLWFIPRVESKTDFDINVETIIEEEISFPKVYDVCEKGVIIHSLPNRNDPLRKSKSRKTKNMKPSP